MKSEYVEEIKRIISVKARDHDEDNTLEYSFFKNLLPNISESLKLIFNLHGLPAIDNITLNKYYETACKEYISVNPIEIDPCRSLTNPELPTWLSESRRQSIEWNYSDRYFQYLKITGRSEKVIMETKNSSLNILEKIGDPESKEAFYVKGLVVGSVQSGKTGNFNAVINGAIDSGYKLIIVLSGIMEDLRVQTQIRAESDIIGTGVIDLEKETKGNKGVGLIHKFGSHTKTGINQIISITSHKSDFTKALANANFSINATNLLVCKKNVSVLRNLIVWLYEYLEKHGRHDMPFLLLDDEADNASLNNLGKKGKEYASKTNGQIRTLLDLFKRKTYLGYTATPFANVLQDRNGVPENDWKLVYKLNGKQEEIELPMVDNLFPDDFIVLLNPPSNYIGAKQIFETMTPIDNMKGEKIPLVAIVSDNTEYFPTRVLLNSNNQLIGIESFNSLTEWEDKNGIINGYLEFPNYKEYRKGTRASKADDNFPENLPRSIKESIQCFILAIAVRDSRKSSMMHSVLSNTHNTMLIHISRFTDWQTNLKDLIIPYKDKLKTDLGSDALDDKNSIFIEFEKTWIKYYASIIDNIKEYLPKGYQDEFLVPISFQALKDYLPDAANDIEVKAINSKTKDVLLYPKNSPKKVIAIGGNRLSRGFTLEGLSINYFIRSTNYSDTLLQMGRWFGYRPGYLDCCKIFTTQEAVDRFDSTTRTIEELEMEFGKMEAKGKSPKDFVLRVKKHPGTLKITRPSIMKNTKEVKWSYQDQLEQTSNFSLTKEKISNVWECFKTCIVGNHKFTESPKKGFLIRKTDIPGILNILRADNNFDKDSLNGMIKFIELCEQNNLLTNWTIAIKTTGSSKALYGKGILKTSESGLPDITLSARKGPKDEGPYRDQFINNKLFKAYGKSANIISGAKDLSLLLDNHQIKEAESQFEKEYTELFIKQDIHLSWDQALIRAKEKTKPERIYREKMNENEALLIIYLFDSHYVFRQEKGKEDIGLQKQVLDDNLDLNIPIIGYAIGFPPIQNDPGGVYVHGDFDLPEEEDQEDYDTDNDDLPTDAN